MPISQSMLPEFDQEMANTRKTLERLPEDKLDFSPHAKSKPMKWLAGHLAILPMWATITMQTTELDLGAGGELPKPNTKADILAVFDKNCAEARAALEAAGDEAMMTPWSLKMGERVFFTMPRVAVLRGMVMNHMIHHRGQLTMYFRLTDTPVPALYGPSADEGGF